MATARNRFIPGCLALLLASPLAASPLAACAQPAWPGKGLAEHDFLYAGQAMTRDAYIVKGGKVVWEFHDEHASGEISDIQLASNGNLVIAHQYGIKVINQARATLWSHPADDKHEIHTAQFIGADRVIFVQSGPRPRIMVANIKTGQFERILAITAGNPNNTHGQLRHARLTPHGTYLLAQMDLKRIVEIDEHGKEVWQLAVPGVWSARRLANGHTLVAGKSGVAEYNQQGVAVWAVTPDDLKAWRYTSFQLAQRLPNGNTLVNHWVNQWSAPNKTIDGASSPAQVLEITPDKRVVWALHQWKNPNLGPSTIVQILDRPEKPEDAHFGAIR